MRDWLEAVYDAEQMRSADEWAISQRGIPSLDLMERAGEGLAELVREVEDEGPVRVICGKGNNGGDGLVCARLLAADPGRDVEGILLAPGDELTPDSRRNLERFDRVRVVADGRIGEALEGAAVIVDAVFGTGFSGSPRGPAAEAIEAMGRAGRPVVAADIPSGVEGSTGEVQGVCVDAAATAAFHAAKWGHLVAPGRWRCGELRVVDIGIPAGAPVRPTGGMITPAALGLPPPREPWSTKFSSGQVCVIGGSRGMTGAVCMASEAAIRCGAGYATAIVPASLEPILEAKLTEVMTVGCPDREGAFTVEAVGPVIEAASGAAAVVLGCGLGRSEGARALAREVATALEAPLVLDADGLNAFEGRIGALAGRPGPTVITPHAGELSRLTGAGSAEIAARRLAAATEAARDAGAVVVLKGDDTLVSDGKSVAVNGLSAPALATAGTGDVLAGAIGALLARGLDPFEAAGAGVLAHARSGRLAAGRLGADSVIATDVIRRMPDGLDPEVPC